MKSICIVFALFCATQALAQDGNQAIWAMYINSLTSLRYYDVNGMPRSPEAVNNARQVIQDSEFERSEGCTVSNIYANPLLINGKMLDYGSFNMFTKGVLTVVKGNPTTSEATPIPFYVFIRREGKILENVSMTFLNKKLYKINLSKIFPFCQGGDLLIIKPANSEDWRAKRILKILEGGC